MTETESDEDGSVVATTGAGSGGAAGAGDAGASGSRILEIVGSALKGLLATETRFLSVFGFSSIRETAFFGGCGGAGRAAGTSPGTAEAFPLLPADGAVIARGKFLLGGGAAEDSTAGLEGVERGGLVAIQIDVRKRRWVDEMF